jgi:trans-AT polyketide synthase, acyltransferase and oxidoreductase domains
VHDTTYAPAGDMFEMGSKVQVVRRGSFFPARANRLYELYRAHSSLEQIDPQTREHVRKRFFGRSFEAVWDETRAYYARAQPEVVAECERNPKQKMAQIFRWYFVHSTRLALRGDPAGKVDYQIHCGPAMGAFNQWVKGTELESWRRRHVADIGVRLMQETGRLLGERFGALSRR